MPARLALIGRRFGRLLVVADVPREGPRRYVMCRCDCGVEHRTAAQELMRGEAQSCGCLHREQLAARNRRHGVAHLPEYRMWKGMKRRCTNVRRKDYALYGGRGIRVCDRWRADFTAFLTDMGHRPTPQHSLDRIDPNGHYEPGNVRWATPDVQRRNHRVPLATLSGQRFGKLLVLEEHGHRGRALLWHCRCACGRELDVTGTQLRTGHTRSCGCLRDDHLRDQQTGRFQTDRRPDGRPL